MRLDAVAEGVLEHAAFAAGLVPASMVRVVWSAALMRSILAGVELGLFDALDEGAATPEQVAHSTGCNRDGVSTLLAALNGFGLLHRREGRYDLAKESRRHLVSTSPHSLVDAIAFGGVLDSKLTGLAESIRTGNRESFHETLSEQDWRSYVRGLGALARMPAREVARKVKLSAPRRLLDVGGGHGMFSVALCRRHPDLAAEILDLPGAVAHGRQLVEEAGMSERVTYREGDLRRTDWGGGFDVVLIFNVLHNLPEGEASAAVIRADRSLKPGGKLVILDGEHGGRSGNLSFAEGFGELLFYLLSDSRTWPEPLIRQWLTEAGFESVRRKRLLTMPEEILLVAQKPGP